MLLADPELAANTILRPSGDQRGVWQPMLPPQASPLTFRWRRWLPSARMIQIEPGPPAVAFREKMISFPFGDQSPVFPPCMTIPRGVIRCWRLPSALITNKPMLVSPL